jgi:hypothetical protein
MAWTGLEGETFRDSQSLLLHREQACLSPQAFERSGTNIFEDQHYRHVPESSELFSI